MAVTAQFTEQVVAMVTPDTRTWLDDEAEARNVSLGQVVREKLDLARSAEDKEPAQ